MGWSRRHTTPRVSTSSRFAAVAVPRMQARRPATLRQTEPAKAAFELEPRPVRDASPSSTLAPTTPDVTNCSSACGMPIASRRKGAKTRTFARYPARSRWVSRPRTNRGCCASSRCRHVERASALTCVTEGALRSRATRARGHGWRRRRLGNLSFQSSGRGQMACLDIQRNRWGAQGQRLLHALRLLSNVAADTG